MQYVYSTNDTDQIAGITAARAAFNDNNPQNLMADDAAFFAHINESQFNQWATQYSTTTATLTIANIQAMQAFIAAATAAAVPGANEMSALMGTLPPHGNCGWRLHRETGRTDADPCLCERPGL